MCAVSLADDPEAGPKQGSGNYRELQALGEALGALEER
jgi:hypothetical protein